MESQQENAADRTEVPETTRGLTRELVQQHLSVLGKNPYSQAFVYTTATLSELELTNLNAITEFPHIQHVVCAHNALESLVPIGDLRLLLSVDASHNQLTQVLDFDIPQCMPDHAWAQGGEWIGSLLRRANLSYNQIPRIRDLSTAHPFLQELYLAHNDISEIRGIASLRFLRVLDLSHNRLRSTHGLLPSGCLEALLGSSTYEIEAMTPRLEALEILRLSHNQITNIDEVVGLPRLVELELAHNKLKQLASLEHCYRLQHLDLAFNALEDVNELNYLIQLSFLQHLTLQGCPIAEQTDSKVFYRARVLRRLQQLVQLDENEISAKEKVKALAMHGSELASRQQVLTKHLPSERFVNYLPPLEFDDDAALYAFYEQRFGPSEGVDERCFPSSGNLRFSARVIGSVDPAPYKSANGSLAPGHYSLGTIEASLHLLVITTTKPVYGSGRQEIQMPMNQVDEEQTHWPNSWVTTCDKARYLRRACEKLLYRYDGSERRLLQKRTREQYGE